MASRIQQYLERLVQARLEVLDEGVRKRGPPVEPTDGLDQSKRARLGAEIPDGQPKRLQIPPLPDGPVSIAQLFTLTTDDALISFDVKQIPFQLVVVLLLYLMRRLDPALLQQANTVGLISPGSNP